MQVEPLRHFQSSGNTKRPYGTHISYVERDVTARTQPTDGDTAAAFSVVAPNYECLARL